MSDVKWIKIDTNIFDDEKIKLIEALPSADSIIVIWFKLLCLAGQSNNSGVFMLNEKIAYTDEMFAAIFRRDISTVRLAISTFQQYGMVEIIDDVLTIPNWRKHQTLDAYKKKKKRDRQYQRKRREEQKKLIDEKKSSDNRYDIERFCSYSYSNSFNNIKDNNTVKDNNIYKDIYIDTIKNIINYLNKTCGTRYKSTTNDTKKHISARLKEGFTEEDFYAVIDMKHADWGNDPRMSEYLRPQTLFGTKFESYLQKASGRKPQESEEDDPFKDLQG